jgi:hypothetical protein
MPCFVAVLCVLCAFVVKLFPFTLVAPLHGTHAVPARPSTTPRSNVIHLSPHVGHQNRPFPTLHASPNSVRPLPTCIHNNFNVIKCNHLYRQLPTPSLRYPTQNNSNVGEFINRLPPHTSRSWPSPLTPIALCSGAKRRCDQLSSFLAHLRELWEDSELIDLLATIGKSV